jgi:methylamine dehydrogenase light chain
VASFDSHLEKIARRLAMSTSRRGMLSRIGKLMVGSAAMFPVLPIDRALRFAEAEAAPMEDDTKCDYWKYCSFDGFLCGCCGGSPHECPPGTEASKVSWVGTCHNPKDGKNYLVSYNDCCGRTTCGRCACNSNVRERPAYEMNIHNDINWCMANNSSTVYHCTVSLVVGNAD